VQGLNLTKRDEIITEGEIFFFKFEENGFVGNCLQKVNQIELGEE
jgi:hypothetical protein